MHNSPLPLLFWFDASPDLSWRSTYRATKLRVLILKGRRKTPTMTEVHDRGPSQLECLENVSDSLTFLIFLSLPPQLSENTERPEGEVRTIVDGQRWHSRSTGPAVWASSPSCRHQNHLPKSNLSHGEGPTHDQVGHSPGVPDRGEPPGQEEPAGALCKLHPHPHLPAAHLHHRPAEQLRRWQ